MAKTNGRGVNCGDGSAQGGPNNTWIFILVFGSHHLWETRRRRKRRGRGGGRGPGFRGTGGDVPFENKVDSTTQ